MVWSFRYEPKGSSFPLAEIVEGNTGHLELVDMTRDGGSGLVGGAQAFSGRRAKPESVPKVIRWMSKKPFQDFETSFRKTVSDRFRDLIEEMEPGVHQFEPVDFIAKDRTPLGRRWFWQICNRLDSVHREQTDWVLQGGVIWRPPDTYTQSDPVYPVFDLEKIGDAMFWHDKHFSSANFCSNEAQNILDTKKISGFSYSYREQA